MPLMLRPDTRSERDHEHRNPKTHSTERRIRTTLRIDPVPLVSHESPHEKIAAGMLEVDRAARRAKRARIAAVA